RICRTILRDGHDAEDAFQATFLVLVRRSSSIRNHDSIASWLHGVARRMASNARSAAARRRARERVAAELRQDPLKGDPPWDDSGVALHEEINRLPETYRTPIVLCDLEELTEGQAAQRLGCPVGTIRSRLARGRLRLRHRLTRRGLAPSGFLGALPSAQAS